MSDRPMTPEEWDANFVPIRHAFDQGTPWMRDFFKIAADVERSAIECGLSERAAADLAVLYVERIGLWNPVEDEEK